MCPVRTKKSHVRSAFYIIGVLRTAERGCAVLFLFFLGGYGQTYFNITCIGLSHRLCSPICNSCIQQPVHIGKLGTGKKIENILLHFGTKSYLCNLTHPIIAWTLVKLGFSAQKEPTQQRFIAPHGHFADRLSLRLAVQTFHSSEFGTQIDNDC